MKSFQDVDTCVEIPPCVTYGGIFYTVSELTFNAFLNHYILRIYYYYQYYTLLMVEKWQCGFCLDTKR